MTPTPADGRSWRAWAQDNFTILVLLGLVIVSFLTTVILMHEKSIPDEYAKWAQGFTEGMVTGLTLAMNRTAEKPHPLAPGTMEQTLRVEPPTPVVADKPIVDSKSGQ